MIYDPPGPRAVVRGVLGLCGGGVGVVLVVFFVTTGTVSWKLLALLLALWGAWSFFDSVADTVVLPLGRFFGNALLGGALPSDATITIDEQIGYLERLLAANPPPLPHRAILAGIRLAEIYRTYQHDDAKADALIARLASQYPDAPELKHVHPRPR